MADYKVTDTELTSIANAIRTKTGGNAPLAFPTGFTDAIAGISGGSSAELLAALINRTLTSCTVPDGVTVIPERSIFYHNPLIETVVLPSSVTIIGEYAFAGCESLDNFTFPPNLVTIDTAAFYGCLSLTEIILPNSCSTIGSNAFYQCTSATVIRVSSGISSIASSAFRGCSAATSVTIPQGVASIAASAFQDCTRLTSVEIPSTVTSISQYAFQGCSALQTVRILGTPTMHSTTFRNDSAITDIYVPWSTGAVTGAPWGATNATIHYDTPAS